MIPVCTAAEVRELDRRTIADLGVPGVALMELAARGVADIIRVHHAEEARRGVLVVCGSGNNGGDGYACARWLKGWGFPVSTWSLFPESRGDAGVMRATCTRLSIPESAHMGQPGLIVDAVFGTGLARDVSGAAAEAIRAMNASGVPVVAVDIPSGIHSDTGAVLGDAVRATRTVTFGRRKLGLFGEPGADYVGCLHVVDIGLEAAALASDATAEIPEAADLLPLWPRRRAGDYKTRSGHLLVVAGSTNMAGAAVLACRGALAAGAGLVTLAAPRGMLPRLATLPPEVMVLGCGEGDRLSSLPERALEGRTAIAAGPGLGGGEGGLPEALGVKLRALWREARVPVVFDADALPFAEGPGVAGRVVTPHPGEAARSLGTSVEAVQCDRFSAANRLSEYGVALLKGRNTIVAAKGERLSINPTNSPVLATGGSGDVLLGFIGGLLARGVAARDGARLAAWIHGRSGERLESRRREGWSAADIADELPRTLEDPGL